MRRPTTPFALLSSLVIAGSLLATAIVSTSSASAAITTPTERLDALVATFRDRSDSLRDIDVELRAAIDRVATETTRVDATAATLASIDDDLATERTGLAAIGVAAYTHIGGEWSDETDTAFRVLAARTTRVRELEDARSTADADAATARRRLDRARGAYDGVVDRRAPLVDASRDAATELETRLASAGASALSAAAYTAYLDAAAAMERDQPSCHLSAAMLVGIGRIASAHGRDTVDVSGQSIAPLGPGVAPVTPPAPATNAAAIAPVTAIAPVSAAVTSGPLALTDEEWRDHGADGDGDGDARVDSLGDAALALAGSLCARDADLSRFGALVTAITAHTHSTTRTNAMIGAARHAARSTDLGLGSVPEDPARLAAAADLAERLSTLKVGTTVADMLTWSRVQLGTPYSQCLGDARPEDPVCPPGTDRFGHGFFDCSGFVSSAFASVGISIPLTTDAMEADAPFMATEVATSVDPAVVQPGDVLLMDGHVALASGDGTIIHANGVGLVEEPIPAWVSNGVFAVLRPLALK